MMTTIMRVFGAYDIPKLLNTPVCHIRQLYTMAERAVTLNSYDYFIGSVAKYDEGISSGLQRVANDRSIPDKQIMKQLLSEENMKRASENIKRIAKQL